ncbi:Na-Ca exchanger/integrin-beta4 [Ruminiclostridium papyrosolvens DSM 2782]|uniref:Na-Ca exchanger/integrin-beta4 n=1 Tax=Ruminiclostridium papyrosolvens DSM 2782 TaxID=588581 RepID=F1TGA4_9FIRM|nr:Calx-beta domain-containing protein [Ruminiclostridium papyrosolvens]EGD46469.1 Na-Ca exchanger/integrin-beta4 [Ruminiclostridium papyrosolvens DSM 2782]WES35200.1 Calx-beta domain-containing protein [Ruminiclostridium papyrosolvens DSM 2782]
MKRVSRSLLLVFCIALIFIFVSSQVGVVYAVAPQDQNFDTDNVSGDIEGTLRIGDLTFESKNTVVSVVGCDGVSAGYPANKLENIFEKKAIINDYYGDLVAKEFKITSNQGTFKLNSFFVLTHDLEETLGTATAKVIDIKGYRGSDVIATATGIDLTIDGEKTYDGGVTYTRKCTFTNGTFGNEYGGILQFSDDWYNIDTVVISTSDTNKPLRIALDSLDFSNLTDLSIDNTTANEGEDAVFKVNLTKPYTQDITVNYSIIVGDSATANADTATADDLGTTVLNDKITISAGKPYVDIKVPIKTDTDFEKDEVFKVTISNPSVGGIIKGEATCTINANGTPPKVKLSIDKSSISEKDGSAKITATLSNKTYENVTVNLGFSGAEPGTDFNAPASITIPAGKTSDSVDITPVYDDIFSGESKNVTVDISGVTGDINGADGGDKDDSFIPPKLTITDNETEPKVNLRITPGSISESGTNTATVTAKLTNKSSKDVTVKLSYANAVKDKDFTVSNDTITIQSTKTEASVEIKGIPNSKFNKDKTLNISTSDADVTNAILGTDKSVDLTITNVDPKPKVTIAPVTPEFNEKDSANQKAIFEVSLSQTSDEAVTVDYETSDGTAKSNEDYTGKSGQLTIPKGETSGRIEVDIINDTMDEYDEDFSLTLKNPIGADLGASPSATCTIQDDDAAPDLLVTNPEVEESDSSNTTKLVFEVKLSAKSGKTVTVTYSTADGTEIQDKKPATQGEDYTAITGITLNIAPGDTSPHQIEVTVLGDDLQEPDETVTLILTADNANGCTATGTIKDNDKPTISISDATVTEGAAPKIEFKVSLSKPCSEGVSVEFRTKDGTALKGQDYVQKEDSVTFDKGEYGDKIIDIDIKDDEIYEGTESEFFNVELFGLTNTSVKMDKATGKGTINDNESKPLISVENIAVEEGDSDKTTASFTVSLSTASASEVSVDYATSDVNAKAGRDYTAATGTLKIPAGQKSGIINVDVLGDKVYEDDETFKIILSNSQGADIDASKGTAICTIKDNDPIPALKFEGEVPVEVSVKEGDSGTTQQELKVELDAAREKEVVIDYVTEDGTATTADNDYIPLSDKLKFAPGETTKKITVSVVGDKTGEPDESFYVTLKTKTGDIKAEVIIKDDDKASIKMVENEGNTEIANGGTVKFKDTKAGEKNELAFTISNTGNSELDLEKPYITINGDKSDFSVKSEPVSPIDGKDSTTFSIQFNPSSSGTKTAEITIAGKDAENSPFTFKVSGTVPSSQTDSPSGGGTTPEPKKETIDINVGDQSLKNIAVDVKNENNTKTTTVNLDETEVQKTLNEMEKTKPDKEKKVVIPVTNNSDKVVGELKASTLKAMADMDTILEVKTETASYTLPANDINIDEVVKKLGGNPELKDILVKVTVTKATGDKSDKINAAAAQKGFEVKGKPVEFEISFTNAGREVTVSSFNKYVARTVAIPAGMDPNKITTGVVYNTDGSFSHVPTAVTVIDKTYYAQINSLTNSTYALIYNPLTFKDVEKHWSKDYVNDAGSRLIVSGTGNGNFTPDKAVTRAEFAVMIVKALGLKGSQFADNFSDVGKDNPYYSYIYTAYKYGIITGYTNGKFGPNDLITREQSMTMISKAMKIAGINTQLIDTDNLNKYFADSGNISKWAREGAAISVNGGLFVGNKGMLNPKNNVTRAESATVIIKLLKNAHLI